MNHLVTFANIGSDLADAAQSTGKTFGFNTSAFIAQCISFVIVAVLLQRFAYKPILTLLDERKKRIAEGLANADKIKAELVNTEKARLEILDKANTTANKLIEEARAAAARVQEKETQKAIAAAEQIIVKAREAAAADHARMISELRAEVGRLVVDTTTRVSGKVLNSDDQKRLAEEASRSLSA